MMSALQRTSRFGSEVTHSRLNGKLVAELRPGPGALLNPKLFLGCQTVRAHEERCTSAQIKHGEAMEREPKLRVKALPNGIYSELASPGPGYL